VVAVVPGCATGEDDLDGSAPTVTSTPLPDPAAAVTNGVDGRPADAVLDQALANLLAAGSYRVSGSPSADEPLDLRYAAGATLARPDDGGSGADPTAAVGRGVTGTLTTQGSTFEILAVDGQVFVRGDLTWLSTQVAPEALTTLGQKWLLLPRSAAVALASFVDPDLFATALLDPQGHRPAGMGAAVRRDRGDHLGHRHRCGAPSAGGTARGHRHRRHADVRGRGGRGGPGRSCGRPGGGGRRRCATGRVSLGSGPGA